MKITVNGRRYTLTEIVEEAPKELTIEDIRALGYNEGACNAITHKDLLCCMAYFNKGERPSSIYRFGIYGHVFMSETPIGIYFFNTENAEQVIKIVGKERIIKYLKNE